METKTIDGVREIELLDCSDLIDLAINEYVNKNRLISPYHITKAAYEKYLHDSYELKKAITPNTLFITNNSVIAIGSNIVYDSSHEFASENLSLKHSEVYYVAYNEEEKVFLNAAVNNELYLSEDKKYILRASVNIREKFRLPLSPVERMGIRYKKEEK